MKGDELDRILDDALASYTMREPRAGFSARTMARVRADGRASWWGWRLALASLAVAALMWRSETRPIPARVQIAAPVSCVPVVRSEEAPKVVRRTPRRDGLNAEQRALLTFAQQAPETARQLAVPDKPLEIEAINIRPLKIDGIEIGEIK